MRENYVGKAGQLAVMAEYLLRGYNVAMPEVDVGDDMFVVEDAGGEMWRVQVKTAIATPREYGFSGRFLIPLRQINEPRRPELYFVLALRREGGWEFVPIPRQVLEDELRDHAIGSAFGQAVLLYLAFRDGALTCSGRDWQRFRGNWSLWPVISP
jgi:hypothetical protein